MEIDTLIIILLSLGFCAGFIVGKIWEIGHHDLLASKEDL